MTKFRTCPQCYRIVDVPGLCHRCRYDAAWARRIAVLSAVVLAILLCGWATSCKASVVTEEFLDRLAWRESRNNPAAVGRAGELGAYQLRACAVEHVNNKRGWKSSHKAAALGQGRKYARAYCQILEGELNKWLGRQPLQIEVDHAYRLGPTGFLRRKGAGPLSPGPSAAFSRATISPLGANRIARGDGPGRLSWSRMDRARIQHGSDNFAPARGAMGLTERHQVPGSIPEQAISCEGREGNGKLVAASPLRHMGERQPDSAEQVGAKGVTAGETASISPISK